MTVICKNCGAKIDEKDTTCPFCHAIQLDAAEAEYMQDLYHVKDTMGNLDDEAKVILRKDIFRQVGFTVLAVIAAIVIGVFIGYRLYISDCDTTKEAEQALSNIEWYEGNMGTLNGYIDEGKYGEAYDMMLDVRGSSQLLSKWEHYPLMQLFTCGANDFYDYLEAAEEDETVDRYDFRSGYSGAMEFLYTMSNQEAWVQHYYKQCSEEDLLIVAQWTEQMRLFLEEEVGLTTAQYTAEMNEIYANGYEDYKAMSDYVEAHYKVYEGR